MTNLPKIGLIADDFTGAMDSGAQFSYSRLGVHFRFAGSLSGDVEIINTASREVPKAKAQERVLAACRLLAGRSLFKKIDSTLRGHVGAEIEAVLSASPYRKAVICPAAPLQSRTVSGGILYVNGIPLEQTSFKDDPVYPAKTSRVVELIGKPVSHLSLDLVRGPREQLTDTIARSDCSLLIADAETPDDLSLIANAIIDTQSLPCGAFGLAKAYLQTLNVLPAEQPTFHADGQELVIIGSANQVAREQVEKLESYSDSLVLRLGSRTTQKTLNRIYDLLKLRKRVVTLCAAQDKTVRTRDWLRFGQTVSNVALELLERFQPETIFVVGGETVSYLCQKAGAESIQILGEAAPGVPYGRIRGGRFDQIQLVTKAGGFGNPNTLVNILYPSKEKSC